jgi:1-acyl-sn-glycerol-3-phosphate acyltransferase
MRRRLTTSPVARTVLSVWSWLVLGVVVLAWFPMVAVVRLVTAPFDPGRYAAGLLFRKLAVAHQRLNPLWTFRVTGTVPDDPRRPYVVVSNHESFVDILLISHLPFEMKWLSKIDFFRYPLVGWMMRLAGDIPLRRGERESAIEALRLCRVRLEQKVSVMIFPEGTRSKTGELGAFKDGAFSLAIEAGVPILPLAVHGARDALRKHDWRFGSVEAEVRVLEPIATEGLTLDDVASLRERVRDRIAAELVSMRANDEPAPDR